MIKIPKLAPTGIINKKTRTATLGEYLSSEKFIPILRFNKYYKIKKGKRYIYKVKLSPFEKMAKIIKKNLLKCSGISSLYVGGRCLMKNDNGV